MSCCGWRGADLAWHGGAAGADLVQSGGRKGAINPIQPGPVCPAPTARGARRSGQAGGLSMEIGPHRQDALDRADGMGPWVGEEQHAGAGQTGRW